MPDAATDPPGPGLWRTCWRLITGTTAICFKYRVTGLASEAAFFALVSLPALVLGVIYGIGLIGNRLPDDTLNELRDRILDAAGRVLQPEVVQDTVVPLLDSVLRGVGFPITILGLAIMLWSGSRWLNVYVDTITIMYGLNGHRHFLKTRALSFTLYLLVLLVGIVLAAAAGDRARAPRPLLPELVGVIDSAYFPVVGAISILFLTSLYHVSVPVRTPWRRDLPGAFLALAIWLFGSFVLRVYLGATVSSTSAYGSLSAAIAVLFWLYVTALAVLIGAGLNAVVDRTWPIEDTEEARVETTVEVAREAAEDADTEMAIALARRAGRPTAGEHKAATAGDSASVPAPEEVVPDENPVREEVTRS